jgi:hypothetical protein
VQQSVAVTHQVASDLRTLNQLLTACGCPLAQLDEHNFQLFGNWLKANDESCTAANVCRWMDLGACDLSSLNEMLDVHGQDPLDEQDYVAFRFWLGQVGHGNHLMHEESVNDWENSPEGEQWCMQRIAARCRCSDCCTCTWRGIEPSPMIAGVTCDDFRGMDSIAELINYGSQPGHFQLSGGDHIPEGWVGNDTSEQNLDHKYVGMPDLTSFCVICNCIRPGEQNLSCVEVKADGKPMRACVQACKRCATSMPQEDCDPEGWSKGWFR